MQRLRPNRFEWTHPTWHGLLGDFGKPIIPLWWAESLPLIGFETFYEKRGKSLVRNRAARQEVSDPVLSIIGISIDFKRTFESLGSKIESNRDDFLDASIGNSFEFLDSRLLGQHLPILRSYEAKFDALALGDFRVSEISGIPIQYFREHGFDWHEIADLSMILSHGLGNIFGILASFELIRDQNLDDCARDIVSELWLRDGARLEDDRLDAIRRRMGIGCEAETLDSVGQRIKVTRERIRQIEKRFAPYYSMRRWPISSPMKLVAKQIVETDSVDVFDDLLDRGLVDGNVQWDTYMFQRLLRAYGQNDIADSIEKVGAPIELDAETVRRIRKHRNRIGFIDLRTFVNNDGNLEDPEIVYKYVEGIYTHTYRSGDIALATDSRGSQAQSAVQKQFAVCPEISGTELLEGIDRVSRNRGYGVLPPTSVVLDLLKQSETIKEVRPGIYSGSAAVIEGDLKEFLVREVKNSPGGVANQPELFRRAVSEGFNIQSLIVYLTYEPMVRKFEGGLIRLAGSNPTKEAIDNARRAGELQTETGSVSFMPEGDGTINVLCILGTNNLNSGVLSPPASLRAILDSEGYSIKCCPESSFGGRLSLSSSTWYGFTPLFNHLRHKHDITDGDAISFSLKHGRMQITSW
jgi:hypothetical protein